MSVRPYEDVPPTCLLYLYVCIYVCESKSSTSFNDDFNDDLFFWCTFLAFSSFVFLHNHAFLTTFWKKILLQERLTDVLLPKDTRRSKIDDGTNENYVTNEHFLPYFTNISLNQIKFQRYLPFTDVYVQEFH